MKKISIVVPMFNEEEMAPLFFEAISKVIESCPKYAFEIVAINDGSKDKTLEILKTKQETFSNLVIVDLSRNWGHESAVKAGLTVAVGDAVIPIDADLQDPPEIIPQMIEMWEKGYQVVNAKRSSRNKDKAFKRNTAGVYYKVLEIVSPKVKIPQNVANYRLLDRRVVDEVNALPETNRVLRVEIPFVGFKTCEVLFERQSREKGESKYNLKSMFSLAVSSILSLTSAPLKWCLGFTVALVIGFLCSLIAQLVCACCHVPANYILWTIIDAILFVGIIICGLLCCMSLYLGQIMDNTQHRPSVIINEVIKKEKNDK